MKNAFASYQFTRPGGASKTQSLRLSAAYAQKLLQYLSISVVSALVLCGMAPASLGQDSSTNSVTLKFSHKTHVDVLECAECHKLTAKNQYPGMDKCGECHDEVKAKEGSKDCLMCHTSNDDYSVIYLKDVRNPDPTQPGFWGTNPKLRGVIRQNFDHVAHFEKQKTRLKDLLKQEKHPATRTALEKQLKNSPDCTVCHPSIKKSKKATDDNFPKRRDCGQCHTVYSAQYDSNDVDGNGGAIARENARQCAVCHKGARPHWDEWNQKWLYPNGTPIKK